MRMPIGNMLIFENRSMERNIEEKVRFSLMKLGIDCERARTDMSLEILKEFNQAVGG